MARKKKSSSHQFSAVPALDSSSEALTDETARLICDDGFADYRQARLKAIELLGLFPRAPVIDNRRVQARVLARQALFGGAAYYAELLAMRRVARRIMKLLADYSPLLSGSCVSGAIGVGHRVQIHLICEPPETVEIFLHNRRIICEQGERRYRLSDGREFLAPLIRVETDHVGVDIAVFDEGARRNGPLSAIDGKPAERLTLERLEVLIGEMEAQN